MEFVAYPHDATPAMKTLFRHAVELTFHAGYCNRGYAAMRVLAGGVEIFAPRSHNFQTLGQKEFGPLRDAITDIIEDALGVDAQQLLSRGGIRRPHPWKIVPSSTKARRECFERNRWTDPLTGRIMMTCHICQGRIDPARERWEAEHVRRRSLNTEDRDEPCNILPTHESCHEAKRPGMWPRTPRASGSRTVIFTSSSLGASA